MKILLSPSKQMNTDDLIEKENDINVSKFFDKLALLIKEGIHKFELEHCNKLSKKAIKLYNGIAFRQLNELEDEFYKDVIVLSSIYGYSYGSDYISKHRLDYTTKSGRLFKKEYYEEINEMLLKEDVIYNLASKEFSSNINHPNIIDFEFLVNGKNISATSKKMRGAMVEYIRKNGTSSLNKFNVDDFIYSEQLSTKSKYVYTK